VPCTVLYIPAYLILLFILSHHAAASRVTLVQLKLLRLSARTFCLHFKFFRKLHLPPEALPQKTANSTNLCLAQFCIYPHIYLILLFILSHHAAASRVTLVQLKLLRLSTRTFCLHFKFFRKLHLPPEALPQKTANSTNLCLAQFCAYPRINNAKLFFL